MTSTASLLMKVNVLGKISFSLSLSAPLLDHSLSLFQLPSGVTNSFSFSPRMFRKSSLPPFDFFPPQANPFPERSSLFFCLFCFTPLDRKCSPFLTDFVHVPENLVDVHLCSGFLQKTIPYPPLVVAPHSLTFLLSLLLSRRPKLK